MGLPTIAGTRRKRSSYMVVKGDARYVVSQDYDTLLFGAPTLVPEPHNQWQAEDTGTADHCESRAAHPC